MGGKNNERVSGRVALSSKGEGTNCRVAEVVQSSTCRWFGFSERMGKNELTKNVFMSKVDAVSAGQPPIKWLDMVVEYLTEGGDIRIRGLEYARMKCTDRNKWRLFCCGHSHSKEWTPGLRDGWMQ